MKGVVLAGEGCSISGRSPYIHSAVSSESSCAPQLGRPSHLSAWLMQYLLVRQVNCEHVAATRSASQQVSQRGAYHPQETVRLIRDGVMERGWGVRGRDTYV